MPPNDPIVGIDLGTTNSLVAWVPNTLLAPQARSAREGQSEDRALSTPAPRILPTSTDHAMLPSVVRYDDTGHVASIGVPARAEALAHPRSTIHSVKRLMGRSFADAAHSRDQASLAYTIAEGPGGTARVAIPIAGAPDKLVSPQEVSAVILRELRQQASAALGVPVSRAVITVPAYFDDAQRQATRDAARLAGLDAVRIINEPTAAALAYGLSPHPAQRTEQLVAVYDLGGGTFDLSILRITPSPEDASVSDAFQVLATSGDTHLGGDDMDHALVHLFTTTLGNPEPLSPETRQSLRQIAQAAKVRLTDHETVTVNLPDHGPFSLTRANFESLIAPLVERTIDACRAALRDAERELGGQPVTAVVLVGGATRVPLVRRRVAEFFGLEPYTALNPDEVVALGAAIQANVLSGSGTASSLLLDVIPLSLGIETIGGAMAKLITRNSTVPARAGDMFSTSIDNQTAITLNILQGEREMAADCRSLGVSHLRGIPPMPAGIPKLRVEFHVDASGILTVHAHEQRSGKRLQVQVVPNHGLTQAEVERIERESVTHAREDMTRHRIADLIANSRLDANWIRRQFDRLSAELEPAHAAELRARLDTLGTLIERASADWRSVDPDEFHAAKEALDRASVRLHEISITRSLRDAPG